MPRFFTWGRVGGGCWQKSLAGVPGKQSLPTDVRLTLELLDERRFGDGMLFLNYRAKA